MRVEDVLRGRHFGLVLGIDYRQLPYVVIDKTADNADLKGIDISDPVQYDQYVHRRMAQAGAVFAVGEHNEKRVIYDHSELFSGEQERRTVHIGLDLHAPVKTPVYTPMDGWVHGIADNQGVGDYGPTIILAHEVDGLRFYTLYGHLHHDSLSLEEGQRVTQGQRIGWIGMYPGNGNWAPHLHFQVIRDMGNMKRDYPGVVRESEREWYVANCPDPNCILQIPGLR